VSKRAALHHSLLVGTQTRDSPPILTPKREAHDGPKSGHVKAHSQRDSNKGRAQRMASFSLCQPHVRLWPRMHVRSFITGLGPWQLAAYTKTIWVSAASLRDSSCHTYLCVPEGYLAYLALFSFFSLCCRVVTTHLFCSSTCGCLPSLTSPTGGG
jgi:hypothetical protein